MIFAQCTDELVDNYVNAGLLDHETYKSWLAQTYFQTKNHDKALLHIAECAPVGTEEKKRWFAHSREEKGHYKLAQRDLNFLGGDISNYCETVENKTIYQRQWFFASEINTNICFGWILALEGCASGIAKRHDFIRAMYAAHGPGAMSFLKLHIEEDDDHLDSAFKIVDSLPIKIQEEVIVNMLDSCKLYSSMLKSLKDSVINKELIAA